MYPDCSWCNDHDTENPGQKVGCHNMTSPGTTSCTISEYHAIDALSATDCCVEKPDCSSCTGLSYCNFCWDSDAGSTCMPNAEGATNFTCPHGQVDVNTCCHQYADDCTACTHGACRWCVDSGSTGCVELSNPSCKHKYASCCGETGHDTCPTCFGDVKLLDPTDPPCIWCDSSEKCIHTDLMNDVCEKPNPIGPIYCGDECYINKDCKSCTKHPTCVWIDSVKWDEFTHDPLLAGHKFCVSGSPFGPSNQYLEFRNKYMYTPMEFYWGSCDISTHIIRMILLTLVVALIIFIVSICILCFATSTIYSRHKVKRQEQRRQRLLFDTEAQSGAREGDESIDTGNIELFEEVPWFTEDEDEDEEDDNIQ